MCGSNVHTLTLFSAVWYQVTVKGEQTPVYTSPEGGECFVVEAGANLKALKPVVEQMKLGEEVSLEVQPSCMHGEHISKQIILNHPPQQMASRSPQATYQQKLR